MKYRYLGRSGLLVSRVCLGTMTFGMKDWGCDEATSKAILDRFIDAGGNFIDTADLYSFGVSEEILGRVIKDHGRDDLVIATKCWFRMRPTPNAKGLSRKNICAAVDASLKRMDTDYIDLYQVHGPDPYTPVEETMRALDDLVRSGKVRYIGCSNYYAWQIVKANAVADQLHLERFISGQHMYSLCKRDVEREILPACADQGLGLMCWAPLASGFLTGKYQRGEDPGEGTRISYRTNIDIPRYFKDENFSLLDELRAVAAETGMTLSQVALACARWTNWRTTWSSATATCRMRITVACRTSCRSITATRWSGSISAAATSPGRKSSRRTITPRTRSGATARTSRRGTGTGRSGRSGVRCGDAVDASLMPSSVSACRAPRESGDKSRCR